MSERAPPQDPSSSGSLRRQAVGHGTLWTLGGYASQIVLRLAGNLVLTRLLFPSAFGLMTIINKLLQGLVQFTDMGIGPSIIQHERGDDPRFLNTAFAFQNIRGLLLTGALWALTYPVVWFYRDDPKASELLYYLPVVALCATLDGLASTRIPTARRHLQWAKVTTLDPIVQGVQLVVMIVWAFHWPTVWALVGGRMAKSVARTLLSYTYLKGIRNWPCWDKAAAQALFHFGKWIVVSTMLTFLAQELDAFVVPKAVGLATFGIYGIAVNLAKLPTDALAKLSASVLFPVFSQLREQPEKLASYARSVRIPLLLAGGTMLAFLIPAGPALIDFLYDPRYQAAGWMLSLLLLGSWFKILSAPNTAALLALGRTGLLAAGNGVQLTTIAIGLPLGYHLHGLPGLILGLVSGDLLKYLFSVVVLRRFGLHVFLLDTMAALALLLSAGLGLALGSQVAGWEAPPWLLLPSSFFRVGVAGGAGAVLWLPALLYWWRRRKEL